MPATRPPRRLTRDERKAATRDGLLAAAAEVFATRGFHGASVDEIAALAGFSTGALYSNFDGKEDLFMTLLERRMDEQVHGLAEAIAGLGSATERARGGARHFMSFVERSPDLVLLLAEFWAYAVRDPDVRPRIAERFAQVRAVLTQLIADAAREFGLELALPAEQLAIAIDALGDGIARQKLADPDAVPDELLGTVLELLVAGAARPAAPPRRAQA